MRTRNLLHRNQLEDFIAWLEANGYQVLGPKGTWEVLRWKGTPGMGLPIVFDRSQGDHFTTNVTATGYVARFLKGRGKG